jgi:predicted nucleic acid-binding protein
MVPWNANYNHAEGNSAAHVKASLMGSSVTIPIDDVVTDRARELMDVYPRLLARDAVHAAVVITRKLDGIASFDRDFDGIRGVKRIEPKTKAPRKARG